jgi:hypothetical protein
VFPTGASSRARVHSAWCSVSADDGLRPAAEAIRGEALGYPPRLARWEASERAANPRNGGGGNRTREGFPPWRSGSRREHTGAGEDGPPVTGSTMLRALVGYVQAVLLIRQELEARRGRGHGRTNGSGE